MGTVTATSDAQPPAPTPHAEAEHAMKGLFGRDTIYLVVSALQVGFAALSIPITTRILGTQTFGVYATAMALMQVLVAFGAASLPPAVQRHFRSSDGGRDARRVVTLSFFTAATTVVLVMATAPLWAGPLGYGGFNRLVVYTVIWAGLTAATFPALGYLRSANKLFAYGLVMTLQTVAAEAVSVVVVLATHRTATQFVLGEMIAQSAAVAVILLIVRPLPIGRRHLALIREALRFSAPLIPAAASSFVLAGSDRLIIRHDLGTAAAGRYSAVYNIAAIPVLLLGMLDTVWMPRFFALRGNEGVLPTLLAQSRDALYRLLIPIAVGIAAGIPLVLSVWLSPAYHPSGLVLIVVTISISAFPVAGLVAANRVLLLAGRTKPVGVCMVTAALSNIGLNLLIVPSLGIEGAALATLAAYALLFVLVESFARRERSLTHPSLGLMLACVATAGVAFGLTQLPAHGVFAVLRGLVTLACLGAFGFALLDIIAPGRRGRSSAPTSSPS